MAAAVVCLFLSSGSSDRRLYPARLCAWQPVWLLYVQPTILWQQSRGVGLANDQVRRAETAAGTYISEHGITNWRNHSRWRGPVCTRENRWEQCGTVYTCQVNLARHNVRKDFFANRVVKYWNYLPADFDFSSIICFKRNLNKIDFTDFLIIQ